MTDPSPGTRCVAVCHDCVPPLPMPFGDRAEADVWTEKHRTTGHRVTVISGWPTPNVAVTLAQAEVTP